MSLITKKLSKLYNVLYYVNNSNFCHVICYQLLTAICKQHQVWLRCPNTPWGLLYLQFKCLNIIFVYSMLFFLISSGHLQLFTSWQSTMTSSTGVLLCVTRVSAGGMSLLQLFSELKHLCLSEAHSFSLCLSLSGSLQISSSHRAEERPASLPPPPCFGSSPAPAEDQPRTVSVGRSLFWIAWEMVTVRICHRPKRIWSVHTVCICCLLVYLITLPWAASSSPSRLATFCSRESPVLVSGPHLLHPPGASSHLFLQPLHLCKTHGLIGISVSIEWESELRVHSPAARESSVAVPTQLADPQLLGHSDRSVPATGTAPEDKHTHTSN